MPLGEVLRAAIQYCEEGFPVAELTAEAWHESEASLKNDEGAAINYLVNGRAPKAGEIFTNPRMAKTLRRIAAEGPDVFYKGDIAEKIVRCSEKKGGLFTVRDFANHRSDWVEPISANYRGYDIYELPPATHGFVALEVLKVLEGFDLKAMGAQSADALHLMIESKKLAFADRDRYLADRDFMKVLVKDFSPPGAWKRCARKFETIEPQVNLRPCLWMPIPNTSPPQTAKATSFLLSRATSWASAPVWSSRRPELSCRTAGICFRWMKVILTALVRTNAAYTR